MSVPENSAIVATVEPVVESAGLFLEDLQLTGSGASRTLQILVDLPESTDSLDLDRLAEVSREISEALDRDDPVPGPPYELEVSTPGATRELHTPRHWRRSVGRMVRVRPMEGERFSARLLEVQDEHVLLQRSYQVKKGMPVKLLDPETLPLSDVREARVEIEG